MPAARHRGSATASWVPAIPADRSNAPRVLAAGWRKRIAEAFAFEVEQRRLFLWLPVFAGTGALLYLMADHEPQLWAPALCLAACSAAAIGLRGRIGACRACIALAAIFAGFLSGGLRTARVAAPALDRIQILKVSGFVEQVDLRREGARFVLRLTHADGLTSEETPRRVRLTTRRAPPFEAGAHISVTARLLPPARPSLPGGYDFARDAFFAGIGGVGTALGRMEETSAQAPPGLALEAMMAVDRLRNALARRVYAAIGGDAGAVGAAMVTGKRDFLGEDAKTLIREAGIFHIITISGVQMTLVAGILFWLARFILALHPALALRYPVKKWAATAAILGAVAYDVLTGSRVGTERALFMTSVMLIAVLVDRQALTMRNLAWAALFVIAIEPEALLGASFQLSFAAVAALVAVYEGRVARRSGATSASDPFVGSQPRRPPMHGLYGPGAIGRGARKVLNALVATACATAATASFMAYNFHELSPYVLVGNPLTLAIIEFFAVPGALLGAALYPFGLDGWVWSYLGLGIRLVFWMAAHIAALPGATVHLRDFAPGAILFLAAAVLSAVIWRSTTLRLTAVPLAAVGLILAASGEQVDVVIAPGGDAAAFRSPTANSCCSPHARTRSRRSSGFAQTATAGSLRRLLAPAATSWAASARCQTDASSPSCWSRKLSRRIVAVRRSSSPRSGCPMPVALRSSSIVGDWRRPERLA